MQNIFYTIAGLLLVFSSGLYAITKIYLKPKFEDDIDDYYYELEEQHPDYARYLKYSRIAFASLAAAVLMMFLAMMI